MAKKSAEKWTVRQIRPGDVIRVYTGRFYHFGIYEGGEAVIHFAGPDAGTLTDPSLASIRRTAWTAFPWGSSWKCGITASGKG